MSNEEKKNPLSIHKCRFVKYQPSNITALCFSPDHAHLAVGKGNGNIEIWNVKQWYCQLVLTGEGNEKSYPRSIVWIRKNKKNSIEVMKREELLDDEEEGYQEGKNEFSFYDELSIEGCLFSCSLDGDILQWDLTTLKVIKRTHIGSGGLWDLKIKLIKIENVKKDESDSDSEEEDEDDDEEEKGEKKEKNHEVYKYFVAVACEDGTMKIYMLEKNYDNEDNSILNYNFLLIASSPKIDKRVVSIAWHKSSKSIFIGSGDGTIRRFNFNSKLAYESQISSGNVNFSLILRQQFRMRSSSSFSINANAFTHIWAITVLSDWTVVTGNSRGEVEFWDGKMGVNIQTLKHHKADIVAIAANKNEDRIVTAGLDQLIADFSLVSFRDNINEEDEEDGVVEMKKWLFNKGVRQHSHDIYALALIPMPPHQRVKFSKVKTDDNNNNNKKGTNKREKIIIENDSLIVSGGVDTQLLVQSLHFMEPLNNYATSRMIKPFPNRPDSLFSMSISELTPNKFPVLCFGYEKTINLYKIGNTDQADLDDYEVRHSFDKIPLENN